MARKRLLKLCPTAERIIGEVPPHIGLTGDALRWVVERCIVAQRKADAKADAPSTTVKR